MCHPLNTPDIAPSGFNLFCFLQDSLNAHKFDNEEIIKSCTSYITGIFIKGEFKTLPERWQKFVDQQKSNT